MSDAATAAVQAVVCPDPGHVRLLLCADDAAVSLPGRELAARLLPEVPWRGGEGYAAEPYRSLVDTQPARTMLNWQPRVRWQPKSSG